MRRTYAVASYLRLQRWKHYSASITEIIGGITKRTFLNPPPSTFQYWSALLVIITFDRSYFSIKRHVDCLLDAIAEQKTLTSATHTYVSGPLHLQQIGTASPSLYEFVLPIVNTLSEITSLGGSLQSLIG